MKKLIIDNLNKIEINFQDNSQTILQIVQSNYIDWMHACGGKGRCTTCSFQIIEGNEHLPEPTWEENRMISLGKLKENHRLACQVKPIQTVKIAVPEPYKLPHINYSKNEI